MYTQGVMIMEQQIDGCLAGARNFSSVGGDGQVGQVGGHGQLGGGGQDIPDGQDTIPIPVEKALASLELGPVSPVSHMSPVSPCLPCLPCPTRLLQQQSPFDLAEIEATICVYSVKKYTICFPFI